MIQAQAVEYLLNEALRSPLRPTVATFIPQLASLRSCLYTQHLIEKREENECANLGILSLRRPYTAPFLCHLAAGGFWHETES